MQREVAEEIRLPEPDRIRVRIFTLADHVAAPENKLYISGGGVDTLWLQSFPGMINGVGLAVRLAIPWELLNEPHTVELRILTEDRHSLPDVNDPAFSFPFELGRPPGLRPQDDSAVQLAVNLWGVPIQEEGRYFIHLSVDGNEVDKLPFRARLIPKPNAVRLG